MIHNLLFAICLFFLLAPADALRCRKCFAENLDGKCKPIYGVDFCDASETETCGLDQFYKDGELRTVVRTCVEKMVCGKKVKFANNNHFFELFTCCNDKDFCNENL